MSKKYTKKLLSYSAVAGAFIAGGQSADAQVVYTDVDPDSVLSYLTGTGSMDIDLDNDGNVDFQLNNSYTFSFWTNTITNTITTTSTTYYTYSYSYYSYYYKYANLKAVGAGAEIFGHFSSIDSLPTNEELIASDPFNVTNNNWNLGSYGTWGAWGDFPGEGDRYVGVRFMNGPDTLYGWIRLNVAADVEEITLLGYAYETQAGVGIHGGDTVGVYVDGVATSNILANSAQVDYTPMKGGNVYMVVQEYADAAPTQAEVISGAGAPGATLIHADTNVAVAETAGFFAISGLTPNTQYKTYLVLVDDSTVTSHVIDTAFTTQDNVGIDFNGIVEFNIFPNPVMNNLNLELPENSMIIVRDLSGREMIRREIEGGRQMLDVSSLESGTYLIEAIGERSSKSLQFIKQ